MLEDVMNHPAIVVVAFNRPESLKRLLISIAAARYPHGSVDLLISIDHSDVQPEIIAIAESFEWCHGNKQVLRKGSRAGLRSHILDCGDLTSQFGSIILLEDDLYVSPYFYEYTVAAQKFFNDDPRVAGVSLYSHGYNETANLAFHPFDDGFDNFYIQLPSSWGQSWTATQWNAFRQWYGSHLNEPITNEDKVPADVVAWPETSWKKYFTKYMATQNLYFSYPRKSLTTNFMDPGTHHKKTFTHLQMPLQETGQSYSFASVDESGALYDGHVEPLVISLTRDHETLSAYAHDLTIDLYGVKPISQIDTKYVLTRKPTGKALMSWGRTLKPHERNVTHNIDGDDIRLCETMNCDYEAPLQLFKEANYFHNLSPQMHQILNEPDPNDIQFGKFEKLAREIRYRIVLMKRPVSVRDTRIGWIVTRFVGAIRRVLNRST